MAETSLKDIIKSSDDIFQIRVEKPDKQNKSSWKFIIDDPRWTGGSIDEYKFHIVHLRRGNTFFMAYKPYNDGIFKYFVDPHRAMPRKSVQKYINSLIEYAVYSNDISEIKNASSFKITRREMQQNNINNFLDLCYHYRDYSAIGIGYTRNLRNMVVMDIDVDCTKPDNKEELDSILMKFALRNALPDFYIFNHESNHVQLQWFIKDFWYKNICQDVKEAIKDELFKDTDKNKEMNHTGIDFTELSDAGKKYRQYTMAMCGISKKKKFGDKNFTFWKAKNPMCALTGQYNLELKMPYFQDGQIKYLTNQEMHDLFSTREARQQYYDEAPEMMELYNMTSDIMDPLMEKITEKKVLKWKDGEDIVKEKKKVPQKEKDDEYQGSESDGFGESRNTFVLRCTEHTTWEVAKSRGYKAPEHITTLTQDEFSQFKNEIFNMVKMQFDEEDIKYNHMWPGTTHPSTYRSDEFRKTFNSGFTYAVQVFQGYYDDEDRRKSYESRHIKMNRNLLIVDRVRRENEHITRTELLKKVNKQLSKSNQKEISMGSLKRYISEIKTLSEETKQQMYAEWKSFLDERKMQMDEAILDGKSQKQIHTCKKRYEYLMADIEGQT